MIESHLDIRLRCKATWTEREPDCSLHLSPVSHLSEEVVQLADKVFMAYLDNAVAGSKYQIEFSLKRI